MAKRTEPTAAQALYPGLASGERSEQQQPRGDLASLMYPTQTKEAKAAEAWRDEYRKRDRESLLRALRMVNGRR
jgi:hypothetical protein